MLDGFDGPSDAEVQERLERGEANRVLELTSRVDRRLFAQLSLWAEPLVCMIAKSLLVRIQNYPVVRGLKLPRVKFA